MKFGILIFPDVEELDFAGPWEMVTMWQEVANGPERCLIVAESKDVVRCRHGLDVSPHESFESCPQLDYLLVPGGQGTRKEVDNKALIEFVSTQARSAAGILSVCTGAFLLHRAGLLSGRRATTHWGSLDRLRDLGDVRVVEERYVRDGDVWTSAGVSAGIDLTLALIASIAGEDVAGSVQFAAEYYPEVKDYGSCAGHAQAPAYIRST